MERRRHAAASCLIQKYPCKQELALADDASLFRPTRAAGPYRPLGRTRRHTSRAVRSGCRPPGPDIQVAARLLVRVETTKAKPVRVNIMLPGDLLAAVDRHAARVGYTRSGLLAQTVRDKLRRENDAGPR